MTQQGTSRPFARDVIAPAPRADALEGEGMAGRLGTALRTLWAKEPVIAASFGIGILALLSPLLSPFTKYSGMINRATPYTYPVPLRDDGTLPHVPSHPCDKEGPDLRWLKEL